MVLGITPCLNTRPPQHSNDITNSKIHSGNLEIFELKFHTYAILLFCSISLRLLVDRFEMASPCLNTRPHQYSNDITNSKIHGNWRYFNLNFTHIMRFGSSSLRLLVDRFEMALDITPWLNTRPPQYSNDITNLKIHVENLEIFQLELHTYHAILLFCSSSLWLLVDTFEMA